MLVETFGVYTICKYVFTNLFFYSSSFFGSYSDSFERPINGKTGRFQWFGGHTNTHNMGKMGHPEYYIVFFYHKVHYINRMKDGFHLFMDRVKAMPIIHCNNGIVILSTPRSNLLSFLCYCEENLRKKKDVVSFFSDRISVRT